MNGLPVDGEGNVRVWLVDRKAYAYVAAVDAKELLANPKCALGFAPGDKAPESAPQGSGSDVPDLNEMTVKQLRAYAKDKGVELGADVTSKDQILAKLAEVKS